MASVRTFTINKASISSNVGKNSLTQQPDDIAVEEPLEIWIKYTWFDSIKKVVTCSRLITTMRTPGYDIELATGWFCATFAMSHLNLLSVTPMGTPRIKGEDGNQILITLRPDVEFQHLYKQRIDISNSSCGVCGQQSIDAMMDDLPEILHKQRMTLDAELICQLPKRLAYKQTLFERTGGIHAAALIDENGEICAVYEDVGRHNAVDKLIGANINNLPGKFALLLSGRVSFELVQKAARAGISMIIAVGAPSSLAIESCIECDISLVGFVKPHSFNVYNRANQVLDNSGDTVNGR